MLTVFTALTIFGGCAAARWYLDRSSRREADCLGGRVRLKAMWNEGAAFGLPLPAKALPLASAAALGMLWTNRKRRPLGTGLVLGGGLSNLCERLRHGRVYDYIQFPRAPGALRRYVFNLADLAILAGGALILRRRRDCRQRGRKEFFPPFQPRRLLPLICASMFPAYRSRRSSIPGRARAAPASLAVSRRQKPAGSQNPLFTHSPETTWLATMSPPE